jgi:hypothetical protein
MSRSRCYDQVLFAEASSGSLHLGHIVLRGSLHGHEVDTGVLNLEFSLFQQVLFLRFGFGSGSGFSGCRAGFPTDSHIGFGFVLFGVEIVVLARVLDFSKACIMSICFWTRCEQGWKTSGFIVAQSKSASFVEFWISLFAVWVSLSILTMLTCSQQVEQLR